MIDVSSPLGHESLSSQIRLLSSVGLVFVNVVYPSLVETLFPFHGICQVEWRNKHFIDPTLDTVPPNILAGNVHWALRRHEIIKTCRKVFSYCKEEDRKEFTALQRIVISGERKKVSTELISSSYRHICRLKEGRKVYIGMVAS